MLIPITDNHFHSTFSKDGRSPLPAIIERGYNLGLKYMTNTEHLDFDPSDAGYKFYNYEKIKQQINELNKLYPLTIYHGVEITYQEEYLNSIENYISNHYFDLIIGSIHYIDGILIRQWCENREDFSSYFKLLRSLVQWKYFDVLGHLDYLKKYTKTYDEKNFLGNIENILKILIEKNKALGVNTSGFRHSPGEQYPSDNILKIYRDLGGELISIGSDSHHISHIGVGYGEILQKLKRIGFKRYYFYQNHIPMDIKI